LNALDGRTWEQYSISVWSIAKTGEEVQLKHPASFPTELPKRLIEIYTKPGDLVLDPFVGSGTTLVAAVSLSRRGIGLDLKPDFVALAEKRLKQAYNGGDREVQVLCADASDLLEHVDAKSVDLVVTSPPYWRVHNRMRTADRLSKRPYSDLEEDLANIGDYDRFLDRLRDIFRKVFTALKPDGRCVVVLMDIRERSRFIPFHMDFSTIMMGLGYVLEDIIIWDRRRDYNRLRPLGYPYVFVVNKVHEYVLIFRKPRPMPYKGRSNARDGS